MTQAPTTGSDALNITGGVTGGTASLTPITFNNAGNVNVSNIGIVNGSSGSVAVVKTGSGLLTFSANNTYSGGTTVNGGASLPGSGRRAGQYGRRRQQRCNLRLGI